MNLSHIFLCLNKNFLKGIISIFLFGHSVWEKSFEKNLRSFTFQQSLMEFTVLKNMFVIILFFCMDFPDACLGKNGFHAARDYQQSPRRKFYNKKNWKFALLRTIDSDTGADMTGFQGPMEPSELHRGGLKPSGTEGSWNPPDLEPSGPQEKKENYLFFI